MGLLFSRFYDKPSTRDTLERIEQEIQNIEERRWDKIKREQFIVQILSFIPITILIATVCILIYPSDSSWRDKLVLCVPIVFLNLILYLSKKVVQWYSRWSLDNEEARLRKLQKEKKKILEMVCETESYRVASELLEKYDPKQLRRREKVHAEPPASPLNTTLTKVTASPRRSTLTANSSVVQQAQQQHQIAQNHLSLLNQSISFPVQTPRQVPAPPPPTPMAKTSQKLAGGINSSTAAIGAPLNTTITSQHNTSIASPIVAASSVQGRPVRPILSKDRSMFEKLVDWVVADGPDNRFALICRYCYGHNGMCLAEEYETINFRCCYCYNLNTATNKRHQIHDQLQPEREKSELQQRAEPSETQSSKELDESSASTVKARESSGEHNGNIDSSNTTKKNDTIFEAEVEVDNEDKCEKEESQREREKSTGDGVAKSESSKKRKSPVNKSSAKALS